MWWALIVALPLVIEAWLLKTGRVPLTGYMRRWFAAWPFFGVLVGLGVGILLGHFFWCAG